LSTPIAHPGAAIAEYFRSIDLPFQATLKSMRATERNFLNNVAGFLAYGILFSFLPLIPAIVFSVTKIAGVHTLSVKGIQIPLNSFLFWWWSCLVIFVAAMATTTTLSNRRSRLRKETWLPEEQLRFALSYKLMQDLRHFQLNKLEVFINDASRNWDALTTHLQRLFNPHGPSFEQTFFYQVFTLLQTGWFRLDPTTLRVINGLDGLLNKLAPRIRARDDLGQVANCLELLSGYLYSLIPGISSSEVSNWGIAQLSSLAEQVAGLSAYPVQSKPEASAKSSGKARAGLTFLSGFFMHENLFLCFVAWWALLQVLVILGMFIALKLIPNLPMDSVIATSLVATPILGAAAIVAVSRTRTGSK
jgi:hypothetical protein